MGQLPPSGYTRLLDTFEIVINFVAVMKSYHDHELRFSMLGLYNKILQFRK